MKKRIFAALLAALMVLTALAVSPVGAATSGNWSGITGGTGSTGGTGISGGTGGTGSTGGTGISSGIGPAPVSGDANGDGKLNARDITAIMKYMLGNPSANFDAKAADFNGDGTVNARDITAIMTEMLKNGNNDFVEAYLEYLQEVKKESTSGRLPTKWSLAYIDEDNIPELVMNDGAYSYLYTYADGEVFSFFSTGGVFFKYGFKFLPRKNSIFSVGGSNGYYAYSLSCIKDKKIEGILSISSDDGAVIDNPHYYINGKLVTKEEWDAENKRMFGLEGYINDGAETTIDDAIKFLQEDWKKLVVG